MVEAHDLLKAARPDRVEKAQRVERVKVTREFRVGSGTPRLYEYTSVGRTDEMMYTRFVESVRVCQGVIVVQLELHVVT